MSRVHTFAALSHWLNFYNLDESRSIHPWSYMTGSTSCLVNYQLSSRNMTTIVHQANQKYTSAQCPTYGPSQIGITRAPYCNSVEIVRPQSSWYLPLARNAGKATKPMEILQPWLHLDIQVKYFVSSYNKYYENLTKISFWARCSWEQIFKIGIFPIPTEVASGFGIFKENRDNPDEIGMVGHSVSIVADS